MKIAIGSDHRGFRYKELIKHHMESLGHVVEDFGAASEESVDYPDHAVRVARSVAGGDCERGLLICATGIGMCITANKVRGVRAALCLNETMARASRKHNDANVLCLGQDLLGESTCLRIVDEWLATQFEGGRHGRRIAKISDIESSTPATPST